MGHPLVHRNASDGIARAAHGPHAVKPHFVTRLIFLAAMLCAAGPAQSRPLDEVVETGTLRVIAYLDNKPFSWSDNDDGSDPKGIDVDLARALAGALGVKADVILRVQGEKADDDLRGNVWRGPLTGGGVGDVMMHVPIDREFTARNPEAVIGNAYFEERVVVAVDRDKLPGFATFDIFRQQQILVQIGTVADYFLMTYAGGALISNVQHYVRPTDGVRRFLDGEAPALMGVRSNIEGLLHEQRAKPVILEPQMETIVRSRWVVGMAVNEKSRDLRDALGGAMQSLRESGKLEQIFSRYGVTYLAPPTN